ncbi:MAG: hypothetical protein KME59_18550 [Trichormus sp. ATA11-4-KO1]|jgi:hypothetical protein|nr:hypothetical protein [Trichormus sp. ATA11-4-KO1]
MYLQDLSSVFHLDNQLGFVELSFNEQIDFAVWVLIESNTKVSPFDLHSIETSLQHSLIKAEQWYEWLATLVAVFDPRWLCKIENLNSEIESEISQYQFFIKNYSLDATNIPLLDWVAIRNHIEQRYAWKQFQYAQAIQEYGQQLVETLSPICYWRHHNETKVWLSQMWELYQNNHPNNLNINQIMDLSKDVIYPRQDSIKKIYFVTYPSLVQHQVSSTTTIIGIPQSQKVNFHFLLQHVTSSVNF